MSSISHLTIGVGDRDRETVIEEVTAALEAATEDGHRYDADRYPEVYEHGDDVAATRGFEPADLRPTAVDRVVETVFNDTSMGGGGWLYQRFGDRFVAVDAIESPEHSWHTGYVVDYFRINYAIAPRYGYELTEDAIGTTARPTADEEWHSVFSIDDPDSLPVAPEQVGRWLDDDVPDTPDRETIGSLLAVDPYYRAGATLSGTPFTHRHEEPPDRVFERLDADDRDTRARAVRRIAPVGTTDPDRYVRFLEAIETVDDRTKALVGADLWRPAPLDRLAEPSVVTALVELTDDPVAELRIGALMGATMILGQLQERVYEEWDRLVDHVFDGVVGPYYDAYEAALTDPDVRVRERAVSLLQEAIPESGGERIMNHRSWYRLPFERRWAIAKQCVETAREEYPVTPGEERTFDDDSGAKHALSAAFGDDPEAVPTLVDYAYDECGPHHEHVRSTLAAFAAENPRAARPAVEPAIEALDADTATTADVELLAAVAPACPDLVAPAGPDLEALLDDEDGDRRRGAARALSHLPAEAVSVDHEQLIAATDDVFTDYRLDADRVAVLAEVSPESAAERIRDLPAKLDDDDVPLKRSQIEYAIEAVAEVDTDVIRSVLPTIGTLLDDPATVSPSLSRALVLATAADPDAVAAHTDAIATLLVHPSAYVRDASATTLVTIGTADPDAVSAPVDTLLSRTEDAIDPEAFPSGLGAYDADDRPADWPAGVIGAADADAAIDAALETAVDGRTVRGDVVRLVREVDAGDPAVAERLVARLLDRDQLTVRELKRNLDERPGVLVGAVPILVDRLAERDAEADPADDDDVRFHPSREAGDIESVLTTVAETAPVVVADAIASRYPSIEAFQTASPSEQRSTLVDRIETADRE